MKPPRPRLVADIECYTDFFCINFVEIDGSRRKYFEFYEGHPLDRQGIIRILTKFTIVTFNGNNYDVPMLRLALRLGVDNRTLKKMGDDIIVRQQKVWHLEDRYQLPKLDFLDHIDVIEPAPSVKVGLKLYAGRLHSKRLQDLPIEPSALIFDHGPELKQTMIEYCFNDCDCTIDLYKHILPQLTLREQMSEQYGVDLRSKSDAQIAETVIRSELEQIRGEKIYRPELPHDYSFQYHPPAFLKFKTKVMQDAFKIVTDATFRLKKKDVKEDEEADDDVVTVGGVRVKISGVQMPVEIVGAKAVRDKVTKKLISPAKPSLKITIGGSTYKMGIGGLHSTESKVANFADAKYLLRYADVGAFYPKLMLVCGIYPDHLGPDFLELYDKFHTARLNAKETIELCETLLGKVTSAEEEARLRGDLASAKVINMTFKIILNGTFGKLGSKWSVLYSPNLMLQVTITGQLVLLMLIEELELAGISIISANTDGIVSKIPRHLEETYNEIIKSWEARTGFEMEFADYAALYSRDVNNYLAFKPNGDVKQKGAFAFVGSKGSPAEKNPASYVCIDAVINYLRDGTPIDETLEWCPDIRRFLTVRRVSGGATFRGEYLGKVVRFYYSTESNDPILGYVKGNKVAKSDGAMPMMELPELMPYDIDFNYYRDEAISMLGDLGVL